MQQILIGSILVSLLHAVIPNHWLPVLAIGRKEGWGLSAVTRVTFLSGLAHALSTALIGIGLGLLGVQLSVHWHNYFRLIAPVILIVMGIFFIWQHYRHHHFHLHGHVDTNRSEKKVIAALVLTMFLSPCMEIEAYFLTAGSYGWWFVMVLAAMYCLISITGMVLWVRLAYKGLLKLNWHTLEHNAGIITGLTLIVTGVLSFFID
ncbi:MAG: hypothetical protein QM731_26670 [Chitinophagaceae bacterium]